MVLTFPCHAWEKNISKDFRYIYTYIYIKKKSLMLKQSKRSESQLYIHMLYLRSVIKSTRTRPLSPPRRIWRPTWSVPAGHWDVVSLGRVSWDCMCFSLGIGLHFGKMGVKKGQKERKDRMSYAVWIPTVFLQPRHILVLSLSNIWLGDAPCAT